MSFAIILTIVLVLATVYLLHQFWTGALETED